LFKVGDAELVIVDQITTSSLKAITAQSTFGKSEMMSDLMQKMLLNIDQTRSKKSEPYFDLNLLFKV